MRLIGFLLALLLPGVAYAQPTPPPQVLYGQYGNWTAQQNFNTNVNPLFYLVNGVPVDRTGLLNSQPAFAAAVAAACAAGPVRSIDIPAGTYSWDTAITLPAGCNNITFSAIPRSVRILPSKLNNSVRNLFNLNGNKRIVFRGLDLDGNATNADPTMATASTFGLVGVNTSTEDVEFDDCRIFNAVGGIWVAGSTPLSTRLTASIFKKDNVMHVTSTAGIHPGAYMPGTEADPDIYVASVDSNALTVTLAGGYYHNGGVTDTLLQNSLIRFSQAFTTSTAANVNDTVLLTTSTTGLANEMAIRMSGTSFPLDCLERNTRIASFVPNTSVTITRPLHCQVPANTNIAAASGNARLNIHDTYFKDIGMTLRLAGSAVFTTAGTNNPGSTLTLQCASGVQCLHIGAIPGDQTAAVTNIPGLPGLDTVQTGPVVNKGAGTYTITLKTAFTIAIPAGTPIPFKVGGPSGNGYPIWYAFGAPWANVDGKFTNNYYENFWSSAEFLLNLQGMHVSGNTYRGNGREFQGFNIAPSACMGATGSIDLTVENIDCSGASGSGIEFNHNINVRMISVNSNYNGGVGFFFGGGHDLGIYNSTAKNNGQWKKQPSTQLFDDSHSVGIGLSGSVTFAQDGDYNNILLSGLILGDDQDVPTQTYGAYQFNKNSSLVGLSSPLGSIIGTGNTVALLDPALGIGPPPTPGIDNRIINPCGTIDQSNEGASVRPGGNLYGPDQWQTTGSPANVSYQRQGALGVCANSIKMTVVTQNSPTAAQFTRMQQPIQASKIQDLKFGTASAKQLIVDFCAQATTAGTYGWTLQNLNGSRLRNYASAYTITAPNTPQCFSFAVAGDSVSAITTVGTNIGLMLGFDGGSGSNFTTATCDQWADAVTNVGLFCNFATPLQSLAAGQSISVWGMRLFPSDTDSTWIQRSDADELALALQYFYKTFIGVVPAQNAGVTGAFCSQQLDNQLVFPVSMRIPPTIITYNPNAANINWRDVTASVDTTVTVNPNSDETVDQVNIVSSAIPTPGDIICIQATANARM